MSGLIAVYYRLCNCSSLARCAKIYRLSKPTNKYRWANVTHRAKALTVYDIAVSAGKVCNLWSGLVYVSAVGSLVMGDQHPL